MDQTFTAASHHDILVLLVQITVLLISARLLGELALRFGQPTVVGEILAGVIMGPSLLSGAIPAIGEWIVPQTPIQGYLLETVSLMGVMFLLLITGLETDLVLIRQQARSAIGVALGGLLLPLSMGFLLGQFIPSDLLGDPDKRFVFALFLATAMSISAIPVVAKVLMDLNLTRRNIGQTIIAAAMIDDTTGWVLLSVVIGIAGGSAVSAGTVLQSIGSVLAFMLISFTIGRWFVRRVFKVVQEKLHIRDKMLSMVVAMMFLWGVLSQALGIEALLGAFVLGILFSQIALPSNVVHTLESVALGIFAPIFFAVAGLKVNALNLLEPRLLFLTLIVIAVATFCKVAGVYIGSRVIGKVDHWTALFFGAGLNARGSMEIIVATIGLSLGVLTQDMFSIIVVMAVTTSLMAPFILRWTLSHIQPDQQELDRLRREELNRGSLFANINRVMLPVRYQAETSPAHQIEACVLERLHQYTSFDLTLFTTGEESNRSAAQNFLNKLDTLFSFHSATKKYVAGRRVRDAILEEAHNGYDLMVLGAPEPSTQANVLFNPVIDHLIRLSPCPTMLIRGKKDVSADWCPRRILVPSNGSLAAQRAAELAFVLMQSENEEVIILRVVEESYSAHHLDLSGVFIERQMNIANESVQKLRELGEVQGSKVQALVRQGPQPEVIILQTAREMEADLIILGTDVNIGTERLQLGPRVERVLYSAPCPVIILNP